MFTFVIELVDLLRYGLVHLFLLFFVFVWTKWLLTALMALRYKPFELSVPPEILQNEVSRTGVIIPVLDEDPDFFTKVLQKVLAEQPGKVIVVINGPRQISLEQVCEACKVDWIYTSQAGKRNAVYLGFKWLQRHFSDCRYVALMDSDTLVTEQSFSELIKSFMVDQKVGGACGTQRIFDPNRSLMTWLEDWIEDSRSKLSMPAFSSVGQIGCLLGRLIFLRYEIFDKAMEDYLNQRIFGVRMEYSDDRYLTQATLTMGFKTVFQSTSIVYTDGPETLSGFIKQQLRWARGSQASTLGNFGWLWTHKLPIALFYTSDILLPFFLLAVFINTLTNLLLYNSALITILDTFFGPGWVRFLCVVIGTCLSIGLRQIPHLRKYKRDVLALPLFVFLATFLLMPLRMWGFFTCLLVPGWGTRQGSYNREDAAGRIYSSFIPVLLGFVLVVIFTILALITPLYLN